MNELYILCFSLLHVCIRLVVVIAVPAEQGYDGARWTLNTRLSHP